MLLLGTCNPRGEAESYNGLYYTAGELAAMVSNRTLQGIPVKAEHTGNAVGLVVSGFLDSSGALQCVMEIEDHTVEGAIAGGFVKDGVAADLSLGYSVDVQNTDNKLKAGAKKMLEISIVRKGARQGCHIHAFQARNSPVVFKTPTPEPAAAARALQPGKGQGTGHAWDCFNIDCY